MLPETGGKDSFMKRIEVIRERNKIRRQLAKKNIDTGWDAQRKVIVLYIPAKSGQSSKEVGYMTSDNTIVMY